jgi:flagellar biosynthesis/type III secretory pathway M-ring protein FliF/YscJ
MIIAAIDVDLIRILLVVGVVVSSGCAVGLAAGRAERRRISSRVVRPALEIGSASSILARASATAAERSSASRPRAAVEASRITGHVDDAADRSSSERERSFEEAAAIVLHLAEHDPKRMAEVITQWIRTSETRNSLDNR